MKHGETIRLGCSRDEKVGDLQRNGTHADGQGDRTAFRRRVTGFRHLESGLDTTRSDQERLIHDDLRFGRFQPDLSVLDGGSDQHHGRYPVDDLLPKRGREGSGQPR